MHLGDCGREGGEVPDAVALLPENGDAWAVLGSVYRQAGEPGKAADALRRAIALLPDQPGPHITLGSVLAEGGDTAGAATERKTAAELSRAAVNAQKAQFALKSGRALLEGGKPGDAEAQLKAAIAAEPNSAEAHLLLAEALDRQGRHAEASLERRIPSAPTHPVP